MGEKIKAQVLRWQIETHQVRGIRKRRGLSAETLTSSENTGGLGGQRASQENISCRL